jgi:hypothetical protein
MLLNLPNKACKGCEGTVALLPIVLPGSKSGVIKWLEFLSYAR